MCPVFSLLSRLWGCIATYYDASTSCEPPESLSLEPEGGEKMTWYSFLKITLGFVMWWALLRLNCQAISLDSHPDAYDTLKSFSHVSLTSSSNFTSMLVYQCRMLKKKMHWCINQIWFHLFLITFTLHSSSVFEIFVFLRGRFLFLGNHLCKTVDDLLLWGHWWSYIQNVEQISTPSRVNWKKKSFKNLLVWQRIISLLELGIDRTGATWAKR